MGHLFLAGSNILLLVTILIKKIAEEYLWKILHEMGIPDHLTCLLRNCMQVKKQLLEPDMEQ